MSGPNHGAEGDRDDLGLGDDLELGHDDLGDNSAYLWDGSGEADPFVAELESLLIPIRYDGSLAAASLLQDEADGRPAEPSEEADNVRRLRPWQRYGWLAAAAALLLLVGWGLSSGDAPLTMRPDLAAYSQQAASQIANSLPALEAGWRVEIVGGTPSCDGAAISDGMRLRVGAWLRTDGSASARLQVADIGVVEVAAESELRIVTSHAAQHRLELTRGSIHASVKAPAGTFVVDTPLGTVVDLGCAYTITLEQGMLTVDVWSGAVALDSPLNSARRERSYVPAGASCTARASAIGTPWMREATTALTTALTRRDGSEPGSLSDALSAAQASDAISLWHLYHRASDGERPEVSARIVALGIGLPAGVDAASLRHDKLGPDRWWPPLKRAADSPDNIAAPTPAPPASQTPPRERTPRETPRLPTPPDQGRLWQR